GGLELAWLHRESLARAHRPDIDDVQTRPDSAPPFGIGKGPIGEFGAVAGLEQVARRAIVRTVLQLEYPAGLLHRNHEMAIGGHVGATVAAVGVDMPNHQA